MWYGPFRWGRVFAPLGWLYGVGARLRRASFRLGLRHTEHLAVPVIVVGNIAVGGTGKTPLTIWLANFLKAQGYRPAIICSGYRGGANSWPQQVRPDSDPSMVGDEPVLLARRTHCPVAAGPNRVAAACALAQFETCDVIISDDGLQHYALSREIEIAVVDGTRRHGTGWCMPAGPLREPRGRLRSVDFVVINGVARDGERAMEVRVGALTRVADDSDQLAANALRDAPVHAVAGVGNPDRFFELLRNLSYTVIPHRFPDHHAFQLRDIAFGDERPVIMTEKDAVKCRFFATPHCWYLPITAFPHPSFGTDVLAKLKSSATRVPDGAAN